MNKIQREWEFETFGFYLLPEQLKQLNKGETISLNSRYHYKDITLKLTPLEEVKK